ncbi:MAG: M50 family metallopeptidase [Methanomassiliicoccales archaeon]|nr:M50 family metallopeptidase [Methanomassiliicoccales archaeon]
MLALVPTTCQAATDFEWDEEFDYQGTGAMAEAGWVFRQNPEGAYLNGSALVLDGTSADTIVDYFHFPEGIEDWRADTRAMWIGGQGGTVAVNVVTDMASYGFWLDGWYSNLNFSINDNTTTFGSMALQLNRWYIMSMVKQENNISLYMDGEYMYGHDFETSIGQPVGVSYISPWRGITQYDYMRFTTHLDDRPVVEWQRTYGGDASDATYSAALSSDGGYVAAGVTRSFNVSGIDGYLVKVHPNGTEQWSHTYGGESWDYIYGVVRVSEGGYILAGATMTYTIGDFDLWLVRVDDEGNEIWNRSYGTTYRDAAFSVIQTSDGGFAATGYTGSANNGEDVWLVKVDSDGNMEWNTSFGGTATDWGKALIQTRDGGYAVAGWTQSEAVGTGQTMGYLVRYNSAGDPLTDRTYGQGGSTLFYGIKELDDGGLMLGGHTTVIGHGGNDMYVVRTDAEYNLVWQRAYGGTGEDTGTGIFVLGDGFMFGGTGNSFEGMNRIYLVRTDLDGNEQWLMHFGPEGVPVGGGIALQTPDGGYLAVGTTNTYGSGEDDSYIAKLGSGSAAPEEDRDIVQKSADAVAAVVVSSAVGIIAVAALSQAGVAAAGAAGGAASASGAPTSFMGKVAMGMKKLLPLDKLEDFVEGYARFQSRAYVQKAESKVKKPVAVQRTPFLMGFSLREIMVVTVAAVLLAISYLIAKKQDWLDLGIVLSFLLVAGIAILLHDLTHRYVAARYGAVAEYRFWGLGMVLMVITSVLFGVVYAYPARTVINDPKKLTPKQQAVVYGAGPMVSLVVFGAFLLLVPLGGWFLPIALMACSMNLLSAVYSLMPFEPMDGRQVMKWKKLAWALTFLPLLALFMVMTIFVF